MCLVLLSKLCITYTLSPQFVINIKKRTGYMLSIRNLSKVYAGGKKQ